MIVRSLYLLASTLLSCALADVLVTAPVAGDTITGLSLSIEWKDSGKLPALANLASYQVFLCAGGNLDSNYIQLATLVKAGDFTDGNTVQVPLTAGLGADVANAYFLKFVSAATGGTVINFSARFSLASMTGTFPPAVVEGLKTVTGTAGPADVNNIQNPQGAPGGGPVPPIGASQYQVPYTLQSGSIRYAPMPPIAPTKITAKNPSRQFPTSAYTPYQGIQGPPNAITTQTESFTFWPSMREATVAAAPAPTDTAMQKFLERWKD